MTDIEGFLAIYGHSDNLLNNKIQYLCQFSIKLAPCIVQETATFKIEIETANFSFTKTSQFLFLF